MCVVIVYCMRRFHHSRHSSKQAPFSWSLFLIAVLHFVVYSLGVCESPARSFLLREKSNFEGFACVNVQQQHIHLAFEALLQLATLYSILAIVQTKVQAQAKNSEQIHTTNKKRVKRQATHSQALNHIWTYLLQSNNNQEEGAANKLNNLATGDLNWNTVC